MSLQQYLALWRWESEHTFINPHTNEPGLGKEKFNFHQIRRLPSYSRSPFLKVNIIYRWSVPQKWWSWKCFHDLVDPKEQKTVLTSWPMRGQDAVNTDHRLSSPHGSLQTSKCLHFISWPHKPFILATNWRPPWLQISAGLWLVVTQYPGLWLADSLAVLCQGHQPHQPE